MFIVFVKQGDSCTLNALLGNKHRPSLSVLEEKTPSSTLAGAS